MLEVTLVALPKLTPEEKMNALAKAQEMRSKRAELRQKLKDGDVSLEEVLNTITDSTIAKMRVAYLLESLPRIGKVRTRQIMDEVGISQLRRVQGLGSRQKAALLARLAK
jgi:hypothetical protein